MTYAPEKFKLLFSNVDREMHSIENTLFDLWSGNVAQFPQHHVTYASAKFIVAMSNGLEGDAFTSKPMFDI